ncbi:MAG: hypothetical protein IPM82_20645 [Saprospiraceae bacterium]|nr:hypothetical protein [Saprospiraceae bacterium]
MCGSTPAADVVHGHHARYWNNDYQDYGRHADRCGNGNLHRPCSALSYANICEDDNSNGNGSWMPVINISGPAGTVVHIRVWGYGGATGTFNICALNYNTPISQAES